MRAQADFEEKVAFWRSAQAAAALSLQPDAAAFFNPGGNFYIQGFLVRYTAGSPTAGTETAIPDSGAAALGAYGTAAYPDGTGSSLVGFFEGQFDFTFNIFAFNGAALGSSSASAGACRRATEKALKKSLKPPSKLPSKPPPPKSPVEL